MMSTCAQTLQYEWPRDYLALHLSAPGLAAISHVRAREFEGQEKASAQVVMSYSRCSRDLCTPWRQ